MGGGGCGEQYIGVVVVNFDFAEVVIDLGLAGGNIFAQLQHFAIGVAEGEFKTVAIEVIALFDLPVGANIRGGGRLIEVVKFHIEHIGLIHRQKFWLLNAYCCRVACEQGIVIGKTCAGVAEAEAQDNESD